MRRLRARLRWRCVSVTEDDQPSCSPPSSGTAAREPREPRLNAALAAATADNSRLRQQLATQRDATAETISALRDQHAALHATLAAHKRRVAALKAENRALRESAQRLMATSDGVECRAADGITHTQRNRRRPHTPGDIVLVKSDITQLQNELASLTSDRTALRRVIAHQRQRIDRLDASRAAADDALATVRSGFRDVGVKVEELLQAMRPDSRSTLSRTGVAQRVSDVCTRVQALVQCVDAFHALFGEESERGSACEASLLHNEKQPLFTPVRERHAAVQCAADKSVARISHHRAHECEQLVPSADEIMPLDDAIPTRFVPRATRTRSLPFAHLRKPA
eukprot:TRINITY_DN7908_c0_g1_i1.p5 TRINITY_DN7908_c0_g1~~TRINITY_DN7908_c0_g1_i1.p5  ORF type:complete len:339 (+),score=72.63 TRINITY_DN7908_c0_g1_i1:2269-3285(+)